MRQLTQERLEHHSHDFVEVVYVAKGTAQHTIRFPVPEEKTNKADSNTVGIAKDNASRIVPISDVILEGDREGSDELIKEINDQVRKAIGPHARPEEIIFTPDLPKTRSGKIMRRVLRGVAEGEEDLGDTSTMADPSVVDDLKAARS